MQFKKKTAEGGRECALRFGGLLDAGAAYSTWSAIVR